MTRITEDDLHKRAQWILPESMAGNHTAEYLKLYASDSEIYLENLIFEDTIRFCLKGSPISISLINCEFKKGFHLRRGEVDAGYSIFLYKCNVSGKVELPSFDSVSKISIDSCELESISIYGKAEKIDLFGSHFGILRLEHLKCEVFHSNQTKIGHYAIDRFSPNEVEFDSDDLAISDYSRFLPNHHQNRKEVSEQYHRFVLKSAKSIRAQSRINYQLTKSTSNWTGMFFGYFYKPAHVILWIVNIILIYSVIYWVLQDKSYIESLYFSVHTFLTIGFGDIDHEVSLLKTILIFSEGLLGIMYVATLLTAIINSSRK